MGPQGQPKCFRHPQHMRNNWELRKRGYLIRFGHTEALLLKKYDIKRPFFPPCRNWPIWAVFLPFFSHIFSFFLMFSFLSSVSDGHFLEQRKWHPRLWWNYCQTIKISRRTSINDLFLYLSLISRYLHLSRLFNCTIVIPLRQKRTFVHH